MKLQTILIAAAGLSVAGVAVNADAQVKEYFGNGGALNDAGFDNNFNTIPGVTRFEIFVPDSGAIASLDSVNLDINHTWVGDLTIDLIHKDSGTAVRLVDRPGFPESTFGNSDDLAGLYSFVDGAAPIPEEADPGGSGMVAPGQYGPSGPGSLADFSGLDKGGIWSLVIQDDASGDTGALNGWNIVMTNPAPGALALLGIAGLAGRRRRD